MAWTETWRTGRSGVDAPKSWCPGERVPLHLEVYDSGKAAFAPASFVQDAPLPTPDSWTAVTDYAKWPLTVSKCKKQGVFSKREIHPVLKLSRPLAHRVVPLIGVGPATPVTETARSQPSDLPGALRHGPGHRSLTRRIGPAGPGARPAPCLHLGRVAHHAAPEDTAEAGQVGDPLGHQAAGAALRGAQGEARSFSSWQATASRPCTSTP